jgi:hypothetical protein
VRDEPAATSIEVGQFNNGPASITNGFRNQGFFNQSANGNDTEREEVKYQKENREISYDWAVYNLSHSYPYVTDQNDT